MRFGSLFAGIGGFDLGLERAGMTPAWQVEIDDYCNRVLEKHWPDVRRYRDVKEVGKHNLEPVDLICGGFPCQPYSVAGKRKGAEDDRNLWPDYLRIVRELRPTWVVGENVPGIIPMYFDTVLSDLEGEEYTCWTFNIPACAVDAPHRRERIFVVGYSEHNGQFIPKVAKGVTQGSNGSKTRQIATSELERSSKQQGIMEQIQRPNEKHGSYSECVGREEGAIEQNLQPEKQMSGRQNTEQLREMVPNTTEQGVERTKWEKSQGRGTGFTTSSQDVDDPECERCKSKRLSVNASGSEKNQEGQTINALDGSIRTFWSVEPNVGRVADGVPFRVDRLRSLGNAVVPQVAEYIGKQIIETENQRIKNHDYK